MVSPNGCKDHPGQGCGILMGSSESSLCEVIILASQPHDLSNDIEGSDSHFQVVIQQLSLVNEEVD